VSRIKGFITVLVLFAVLYPITSQRPKTTEASAVNKAAVTVQTKKVVEPTIKSDAQPKETTSVKQVEAPKPTPQPTTIALSKQEIMTAAGIPQSDWAAVDYIVSHESSWRNVVNNIGATGLCQALPASKMASAGDDYLTNVVTQMKWCNSYAQSRYGGWWNAYNFWTKNHWW